MFKKITFLLMGTLLLLSLDSCAQKSFDPKAPTENNPYKPMTPYPGNFDTLTVNGNLNVIVTINPKDQRVIATSPDGKVFENSVYYQKYGRHLELARGTVDSQLSAPCVFIQTPSLKALDVHHAGQVIVLNVKTPHFRLTEDDRSFVRLCGEATRLDATLIQRSRLDAKTLNTETIFLNSSGISQAEVRNVGGLSTIAGDVSDVYYYTDPKLSAHYEEENGSVMRMKGIYPEPPPPPTVVPNKEVSGLG